MAEIQIFCTNCDYRFTVSAELAGTDLQCPHCKETFKVAVPQTPVMEQTTNRPAAIAVLLVIIALIIIMILAMVGKEKHEAEKLQQISGIIENAETNTGD